MKSIKFAAAFLPVFLASPAVAATISDPANDFLPSFVGTASPRSRRDELFGQPDPAGTTFTLGAVLAGQIDPALAGFYVIGVDTGAGAIRPFGGIGEPNVIFDQVIVVQKNGSATLGANSLGVSMVGNQFILTVPSSLLPSTGASLANYGFNIWPRFGDHRHEQQSDLGFCAQQCASGRERHSRSRSRTCHVADDAAWLLSHRRFDEVPARLAALRARLSA